MFRFILFFILLIAIGGAGSWFWTSNTNDASEAHVSNDIDTMLSQAKVGDVKAEYGLGEAFRLGKGVEKSIPQAFKWYGRAAENGHVQAQYELGLIYETGVGIKKNIARAAEWYRLAASFGHLPDAQFALGQLYFHGRGVSQDYVEAFNLFEKAARQGHPVAQHLLGGMYEEGWVVKRNFIEAYKWYTLAIPGRERAMAVNRAYDPLRSRGYLIEKMNKFQIGRGEELAKAWRKSP